jgi:type I restriction enzyme M protein
MAARCVSGAWLAKSLAEAEYLAVTTASVTHDHPEGLRGARAIAGAIWFARQGMSPDAIQRARHTTATPSDFTCSRGPR